MDSKLHILQHSLGLNQYGEGSMYRNHFVTGAGSQNYPLCQALVADGLMVEHSNHALVGGDSIFVVTSKGVDYVALNSPPAPKLTRSQKRYRDWLSADCGMTFAQWIGAKR